MAKEFQPKIVSANDLIEGDVVYLQADGSWTRQLADATVATNSDDADRLLTLGDQPANVIGPYLVDVALDGDTRPAPTHFREKFRDLGPSNRPDLGRQADPVRRQAREGVA